MKFIFGIIVTAITMASCNDNSTATTKVDSAPTQDSLPIIGTWKLLTGTLIDKKDTTVTDYTKDKSQIKIINGTHFAFLNHTNDKTKTTPADFVAGGGHYTLVGDKYTEMLEYCSDRQWENNNFDFTITIKNDTLVQTGVEKVEGTTVNRLNIERYVRVK